jgi:transcriptional antiterminator NusG
MTEEAQTEAADVAVEAEEAVVETVELAGQWFVVQTLSGQEMKAKDSIDKRLAEFKLDDRIFEVLVPMERVTEVKLGKKTTTNRKFFPGYVLVNTNLYHDDGSIDDQVWAFIQETNGIIGFMGGQKPLPLTEAEVQDIMDQLSDDEEAAKPRIEFEMGEMVKIRDGAFENFEGKIESIDPDRGKLKLSVTIFGRSTPVEVEYWQVERT